MSGIHQFVPMLHRHDAVGEHTRSLQRSLVAAGVTSRIYTELPDPRTAAETSHYLSYEHDAEPGDVVVYQLATESVMARWLAARPERLVVNYHSITPPELFERWNNGIARIQVECRYQLADIAPLTDLGIAVSRFDEGELRQAGCARTVVIPVANVAMPPLEPDVRRLDALRARRAATGAAWLSVGRLAPNKDHQATIAALFVTRMTTDPAATLTLVGSPSEPSYAGALHRYVGSLGHTDAVDFVSAIDDAELAAFYRSADVLVMLSDHEGFGVPLVEAMGHGTPVVAYDAGAVGEVLGDAGVLLDRKDPRHVASAVAALLADGDRRRRLAEAGRARLEHLGLDRAGNLLVEALLGVAGPGGGTA